MKPILFSTSMVQAILAGRKTQTRRVVKPGDVVSGSPNTYLAMPTIVKSPHRAGDILWVRETWMDVPETAPGNLHYKASATQGDLKWLKEIGVKWCPSIFMPKEAARIFLRVTDVRLQRVQDISQSDAKAEGLSSELYAEEPPFIPQYGSYREGFEGLWDSINGKRGYGWDANPWVWAYTFERTSKEEAGG